MFIKQLTNTKLTTFVSKNSEYTGYYNYCACIHMQLVVESKNTCASMYYENTRENTREMHMGHEERLNTNHLARKYYYRNALSKTANKLFVKC